MSRLWRGRVVGMAAAAAVAVVATGCEKTGAPVPVPTTVASPTVVETFPGTLMMSGSNLHNFQITRNSEIDVTLTTLTTVPVQADPNADPPVAAVPAMPVSYPLLIRVGQPTITTLGVTCSNLKSVTTSAGSTPQLTGQALPGTFCVGISDPGGTLPQSVDYVITVAHG
jgi:hypothetical protein